MKKLSFILGMLIIGLTSNLLQAQWVQTSGPYGGMILSFAVSDTNLFAGTACGGVWRRPISDIINAAKGVR